MANPVSRIVKKVSLRTRLSQVWRFVKRPRGMIVTGVALIVLLIIAWQVLGPGDANAQYEVRTPARQTITEEVSVTGRIQPTERLELALQSGGKIAFAYGTEGTRVREGQTLVSLGSGDLSAQLAQAAATLDRERVRLRQILAGARPETVASSETSLENARHALEDQLHESYASVDSALGAYVDQFYEDPRGTPDFGLLISSGSATYHIGAADSSRLQDEQQRSIELLGEWQAAIDDLGGVSSSNVSSAQLEQATEKAQETARYIQDYLADLALAINRYRSEDTAVQPIYDGFKADVAAARTGVNSASAALSADEQAYRSAQRQHEETTASADPNDVAIQEAVVRGAEAQVALVRAHIAEHAIVSPVDGVLTKQDAKVGENASVGTPLVGVMADAALEIEAFVPEADVAKVQVGDEARVTLDAYSGETFAAKVIFVAPAETLTEGVATYKIKLQFDKEDSRIKPGMTADLDIVTASREDVLALPQRAVLTKNGKKIVRVLEGEETVEKEVTVGIRGTDGSVEIVSGLSGSEQVIVNTAAKE